MTQNKQTLHFMAGLPRCGSTLLVSILSQNKMISGVPISGLCGIITGIYSNWDKIDFHKEVPNDEAKRNVLNSTLHAYHQNIKSPIIIDKERHWTKHLQLLEEVLQREVKIIQPVRPIVEILASFETLRQQDPLRLTGADDHLGPASCLESRCEYFNGAGSPIGSPYAFIKDAVVSGYLNRFLFVDYNKLIEDPEFELERIYDFLELPYFEHDLDNIQSVAEPKDDVVWNYPGLHHIRTKFGKQSVDPKKILGEDLAEKYTRSEPWEDWS